MRIRGETGWPVPALRGDEAQDLFVKRARDAHASLAFSTTDNAVIASICQRLDCIPLAIELAAARVPALVSTKFVLRQLATFRQRCSTLHLWRSLSGHTSSTPRPISSQSSKALVVAQHDVQQHPLTALEHIQATLPNSLSSSSRL